jgi:sec-independent protein translocase protein TatA
MFRNPTTDLIVVLVIVLLIFGPKRLPGLGRQLGEGIREFKDSITGKSGDEDEERPAITSASAPAAEATAPAAPAPAAPASAAAAPAPAAPSAETAPTPERESAEVGSERRS